ncbi:MAG: SpoVR family protein [Candidatus Bipolaricaulia bacterium]
MSINTDRLERLCREVHQLVEAEGLDPLSVEYAIVAFQQMNELAAYDGFPERYPHWRFGMKYDLQRKRSEYSGWWIYEMVLNTAPALAYLRESNTELENKAIMVHVYAHSDFFKNNQWYSRTRRDMITVMRNHADQIESYMNRRGVEQVESFLDRVLSLQYDIDQYAPFIRRKWQRRLRWTPEEDEEGVEIPRLPVRRSYMDQFINPSDWIEKRRELWKQQREKARHRDQIDPEEPQKDVIGFLIEHGRLEDWQANLLAMIHEESYYFVPQIMTKLMNEGWACVVAGTPVFTDRGILSIEEVVEHRLPVQVSDGERFRRVYEFVKFPQREIVKVRTRRGFELAGSTTHQVRLADGKWRRLDELCVGDQVQLGTGLGCWAREYITIQWEPVRRFTLEDAAKQAGVSLDTILRYRKGITIRKNREHVSAAVALYEASWTATSPRSRRSIQVPEVLHEELAAFLGYLTGDGHLSRVKRVVGLTTGDEEQAERFRELGERLFSLRARMLWDDGRWRVLFHSLHLMDFLEELGLKSGRSARQKEIPQAVLRSPKSVVASFLRAYFDCDAYAGVQGVILSTASEPLARLVQVVLLNFGILSRRRRQKDSCWHVHIAGRSAKVFQREIGFGLLRKRKKLEEYLHHHHFFKSESFEDEIVSIESGQAGVYDISVAGSHRYAAAGFINHNSFWQSRIMSRFAGPDEIIDHADMQSKVLGGDALNPYALGKRIWERIKERWDKGQHGPEWEECTDQERQKHWDTGENRGLEKIFEVRRNYNDVMFIDEFFTEDLFMSMNLFTYEYIPETGAYHITSRRFEDIKKKLLFQHTNLGRPIVKVRTGNYGNKRELLLVHEFNGVELHLDDAKRVLENIYAMWGRPINLKTVTLKKLKGSDSTRSHRHTGQPSTAAVKPQGLMLRYDGVRHIEEALGDNEIQEIMVDDLNYNTIPKEWVE